MATYASLPFTPKFASLDENGDPHVGGKLYTYETGTTTPKTTWTDRTKATPNTNPVILDSMGQANVWVDSTDGAYRFVLKDSNDVTIWSVDNVQGIPILTSFIQTLLDDATAADALTTLEINDEIAIVQTISAFVQTLLNDADAAAFLTTLGVSTFVQTILNDADAATVRGTIDVQQLNANLTALAGLTLAANNLIQATGVGALQVINQSALKLDDFGTPDDNTDLNATTTYHGLLKKLSNVATEFMNGAGNWAVPVGKYNDNLPFMGVLATAYSVAGSTFTVVFTSRVYIPASAGTMGGVFRISDGGYTGEAKFSVDGNYSGTAQVSGGYAWAAEVTRDCSGISGWVDLSVELRSNNALGTANLQGFSFRWQS